MAETERIYCYDKPSDNSALWATLMSNKDNPAETCYELAVCRLQDNDNLKWIRKYFDV